MNDVDALLAQLVDVKPPAASWVPAIGWWIVAALTAAAVIALYHLYRRHQSRLWQRQAHAAVQKLRDGLDRTATAQTLSELSKLARQVMLTRAKREEVASLHGREWLEYLDDVCGRKLFSEGYGRLLETGPYQREPEVGHEDLRELLDAVDDLIRAAARV